MEVQELGGRCSRPGRRRQTQSRRDWATVVVAAGAMGRRAQMNNRDGKGKFNGSIMSLRRRDAWLEGEDEGEVEVGRLGGCVCFFGLVVVGVWWFGWW